MISVKGSSSVSSEECILGSVMPSHEDSSMDALDSLSLDPSAHIAKESSSSESEEEAIRFKSSHFNGDSSPEELLLLPGEREMPGVDPPGALSPSNLIQGALSHLAPALFAAAVAQASHPPPRIPHRRLVDEDSDSDFEIIESEDVS